jgi:heme A synthase
MPFEIPESVAKWSQFFHPVLMWVLLGLTIYALYLGLQWRRTRTAEGDEKKELLKGKFNIKHHQIGSLVLALMVVGAIGGMAVTYLNNGKLFVGSHLLAGLGMTALIALSASLTPLMQKGQDWARYTHISLNVVLMGLFGWQALTGVQIVQRIVSKL